MMDWLLSQPWLPFLIMGIIIVLAVYIKVFLIKIIFKMINKIKAKRYE